MTDFWKKLTENWQDGVNLALGLWLIASAWALGFTGVSAAFWNAMAAGAVIVVTAITALTRFHEWEEWADAALGVWLILSPWILGFNEAIPAAATWNFVVVGALTILLAVWSIKTHRDSAHA